MLHFLSLLACSMCFLVASPAPASDDDQPTTRSPLFTVAQAERGRALYESSCANCHGMKLIASDPSAASLTAFEFRFAWHGQTIAAKLATISSTMPPGGTAALEQQQYIDIIAYILKFNGYPAGPQELPSDLSELEKIIIGPASR